MHGDMSRAFNKGILWFTNFTDWLVGVTSGQNDVQTPQAESDGESRTCFTDVVSLIAFDPIVVPWFKHCTVLISEAYAIIFFPLHHS